jgi:serine/threonine protein kinase
LIFRQVYLVEHKARKQKLALKVMEKRLIAEQNKIQHILNERDVLVKSKVNPFLVHLWYSFQDEQHLFFAMEFCSGGDLRSLLTALGTLAEEEAKLYFAEMIVGVSTLHSMGYIHRDLKPDNFLIDNKGHLKLADFGLSKHGVMAPRSMKVDRMASRRSILLGDQQLEQLNQENFNNRFVRTRSFATLVNRRAPSVSMVQTFVPGASKQAGRDETLTQSQPGMIESFTYVPGQTNDLSSTYNGRVDRPPLRTLLFPATHRCPPLQLLTFLLPVEPSLGRSTPNGPAAANGGSSSPSSAQRRRMLAYSVVGSPDYMSPEVLNESGYSQEVDWWSLGCNFFEMIMGTPPFAGDSPQEVFENIQNWRTVLPALLQSYSEYMSPECFSLITGMLAEPGQRLGSKGIEEFKQHPFFAGLDWNNLHAEEPPFIPKLTGDDDTSYFNDNVSGIEGNIISVNSEGNVISKRDTPPPTGAPAAPSSPQHPSAMSRQTTQVINTATSSRRSSDNAVGHVRSFTFVGDGASSPVRERSQSPSPPPIPQLNMPAPTPTTPTNRPSPPLNPPGPSSPTPGRPQPPNVTVPLMSATIIGAARPAAQPQQARAPPLPAPPPQSPKTAVPPTVLKRGPAFSNGMGLPPAMPN